MKYIATPTIDGKTSLTVTNRFLEPARDVQEVIDMTPEDFDLCFKAWMDEGMLIQHAFSGCTPEEREFIMNGLTFKEQEEFYIED